MSEIFCIWYDEDDEIAWSTGEPSFYDQDFDCRSSAPCPEYYYFDTDLWLLVTLERSPFAAPNTRRYCYVTSELSPELVVKHMPPEFLIYKLLLGK